jgi:hypothetical protein
MPPVTIGIPELISAAIGAALGWLACAFVRWMKVTRNPCTFCNGHGHFASDRAKTAVFDSVLEESKRFKP